MRCIIKKLSLWCVTLSVCCLIHACNDDLNNDFDLEDNSSLYNVEPIPDSDQDILAYAVTQRLANSLTVPEVRDFVKKEIVQQFDGDYDALLMKIKDKKLTFNKNGRTSSVTFGEILNLNNVTTKNQRNQDTSLNIESTSPLLQISIPELQGANADSWNTGNEVPLIAYVPEKIKNDIIPAYDTAGNYIPLSASTPPNRLVIVVSQNERVYALENKLFDNNARRECDMYQRMNPVLETERYRYVLTDDYYEAQNFCQPISSKPPTGGGGGNSNSNCDRDRKNGKDQLVKMKFRNLTAFRNAREGWYDNRMEIRCYIFLSDKDGNLSTLVKPLTRRESKFKDCGLFSGCKATWVDMSTEIVTWDKAEYGNRMKYMWIEHDGKGNTINSEISLNTKFTDEDTKRETNITSKTTLTYNSDDYLLGDSMVEYCDNTDGEGYQYSTPDIFFYVNQK